MTMSYCEIHRRTQNSSEFCVFITETQCTKEMKKTVYICIRIDFVFFFWLVCNRALANANCYSFCILLVTFFLSRSQLLAFFCAVLVSFAGTLCALHIHFVKEFTQANEIQRAQPLSSPATYTHCA